MNIPATHPSPRSARLRRRLVRHHLPLLVISTFLIALLHVTYTSDAKPAVTIANSPQQGGQLEHPQQGGHLEHPQQGGQLEHSQQGGQPEDPQQGGHLEHPQQGGQHSGPVTQAPGGGTGAPVIRRISQTSPFLDAFSIATGYTGLALIAATLLFGPLQLTRQKRVPVSTDLRRDIGIWAAIISVLHVVVGLKVHTLGRSIFANFVSDLGTPLLTTFGWANHVGLVATLILLLLAGLSNDALLQRLGVKRWKRLQRLNYLLFALIIAHSVLYELYHSKNMAYPILLTIIGILVIVGQLAGVRLHKAKSAIVVQQSDATA